MKINIDRTVCRAVRVTVWGVSLTLLMSSPILANTIPHQVINGLYRSSSEDFFLQGKRQFEKEIQILRRQLLIEPRSLLNISDEVQIKEEEVPETPDFSPENPVNNKKSHFSTTQS
ncbi:hypothetical protein [Floridanema evergladense]|uniref:Uncharacterized protein n=1 Tax=Floridaenema evergladense BLCC-F167 TaxID=3153639 RepID=A0ABV4WNQ9_9CYAN